MLYYCIVIVVIAIARPTRFAPQQPYPRVRVCKQTKSRLPAAKRTARLCHSAFNSPEPPFTLHSPEPCCVHGVSTGEHP